MAIIDTSHYVDIINPDTLELLGAPGYTAVSSDPAVAEIGVGVSGTSIAVGGVSDGPFTITITQLSDGAAATLSDEVGVMGGTFNVAFGDVHLKG